MSAAAEIPAAEIPVTEDRPAPGLVVLQPRRGFRYAMDPFLLAGWALEGGVPADFLDVGTGSGVIALLLARLGIRGEGIDVLPEWIALARQSAARSGLCLNFRVQDIRHRADVPRELVLCNPPYGRVGAGPLPSDATRAAARHELHGALGEIVPALARAGARVALIVPASRGPEAAALLGRAGRPLRRRLAIDDALVLLEGAEGATLERDEWIPARLGGDHSPRVRDLYAQVGATLGPHSDSRGPEGGGERKEFEKPQG